MIVIGLTGGIASGKSLVARRLAELGAAHVDADAIAREVVAPGTPALEEIVREFGPGVLRPDGTLDRAAIAAVVFSDPNRRDTLNSIVHPAVRRRSAELIAQAEAADPDAVVVYDVPLLVETQGRGGRYDLVVVVHAPVETRIRRMVDNRGMSREDAERRIRAQAPDERRLEIADVVIENDGPPEDAILQVDRLWRRISGQGPASAREPG